jgi:Uncharacterized protein conserved in bacteria
MILAKQKGSSLSAIFGRASFCVVAILAGFFYTTGAAQTVAPFQAIKNAIPYAARPLPLSDVRLTGGPLKHAQELDADYLLKLEPDRMLFYLRQRAGLEPKAQQGYGGWDGAGRQLTGHIAGHYLSAVSYMWAATGDPRFKERADYLVKELKEIQDKQGDGYVGALMANAPRNRDTNTVSAVTTNTPAGGRRNNQPVVDGKERFAALAEGTIQSGGFDLNGMWSPWYVEHKIFAGLRDAYRLTGNRTALDVEIKFAGWVDGILSKLDEAQIQRMLATEFGGMNEVMADLYADTGDPRWLKACDYFEHHAIVDPLARHDDILAGKHGNTQVPKMIGELARYIYTGDSRDGFSAAFFWDEVANHHSFVTGGHGRNEYFGQPDKLNDMVDGRTAESCNVYNMLKMTRTLFALWPDAHYADFQERALFNHVLGSIDPTNGSTCYMVCVGDSRQQREYANMFQSFTCCVGTGMENHALHGDGIYYESGDKLWVNIYAPSTAEWKTAGVKLQMETGFPEGDTATLKLTLQSPRKFTLSLRRPYWAGEGFAVTVNGEAVSEGVINPGATGTRGGFRGQGRGGQSSQRKAGSYVELKRVWKTGDTVSMVLPKTLRLEALPDNPRRAAVMWGPLVLAGDLSTMSTESGAARTNEVSPATALVAANRPLTDWLKPVPDKPGHFRTEGVGQNVELLPFYQIYRRAYRVYWNFFTPEEWQNRGGADVAEQEKQRKLEAATVGFAQPGQMQAERDVNQQGEESSPFQLEGRYGRRGAKWFSFDLPVDATHPMTLVVTYHNDEQQLRTFEVQVDGKRVGEQAVERRSPEQVARFFDVEYPIPAELVKDKPKVTVRFQATNGNEIAAVFGVRMIRADAAR